MLNNWTEMLSNLRKAAGTFGKANPTMMQAYVGLAGAQSGNGTLDAKTRDLMLADVGG